MFYNRFSHALLRLFCLMAFALCFSGLAHAQNVTVTLSTPPPVVEGTNANGTGAGGNQQNFQITLSRPATQALTLRVSTQEAGGQDGAFQNDRPPLNADYIGVFEDVTIPVGQQQVSIPISIIADRSYEFNERYFFFVSNARYNGAPASGVSYSSEFGDSSNFAGATGIILDDDAPPRVTFLRPAGQIEGDFINNNPATPSRTAVSVTVNVDVLAGRPLQLQFDTIDNSTQAGAGTASGVDRNAAAPPANTPFNADLKRDYQKQVEATVAPADQQFNGISSFDINTGLATILPGTSQFIVRVIILGDRVYEGDEAFTLRLRYSPSLANTVPDSTLITIIDDDLPTYKITDANNRTSDAQGRDTTPVGQARANEGSNVSFLIELVDFNSNAIAARSQVTFQYELDDISARLGADYTNPNGTISQGSLTIPVGGSSVRLDIPALLDGVSENPETFRLRITSVTGISPTPNNSAIGTIISNDGTPVIAIADSQVVEGTDGLTNMVFTVTLSSGSSSQVTVDYETLPSVPQSATPNVDYSTTQGRLTFPASNGAANDASTRQTFSVPIVPDAINEPNETFRVRLFNPAGGNVGFPGGTQEIFATGTILDDDAAGTVSMGRAQVIVAENVPGRIVNIPVTFTPNGTPARPITVDFTTVPGTAVETGRIDYFSKSGRLTFQPSTTGQTKNISIEIFDDNIRENDEQFIVRLTAVDGAVFPTPTAGSNNPPATDTVVIIKDNEPLPQIRIAPVNARVIEGNGTVDGRTTQSFNVFLLTPSQAAITLNYRFVDGDGINPVNPVAANFATRGVDYEVTDGTPDDDASDGTITFTIDGPKSIPIEYEVLEDNIAEPDEFFTLALTGVTSNFIFENNTGRVTSTIVDNDRAPEITVGDASVVEGNAGTIADGAILTFPVTLSRPASRPVTFTYSTVSLTNSDCRTSLGCGKASDDDYANVRDVPVTIAPGETTATITVRVAPDTGNEFDEQFTLILRALVNTVPSVRNVPSRVSGEAPLQRFGTIAYGTIINDDAGGVITIANPPAPVAEGYKRDTRNSVVGDVANFVVTLPTPPGRPVTVDYTYFNGSASPSDVDDLTTGPGQNPGNPGRGQVTFFPGDTTRTIALRAIADNISEQTETLRVVISIRDTNGPNSYTVTSATSSAQTTILDRTPRIGAISTLIGFPAYGTAPATQVTISGANFRNNGNPRVQAVLFNGVRVGAGGIRFLSDNALAVDVPRDAKSGPLSLILADGSVLQNTGFFNNDVPSEVAARPALGNFVVQPVIDSFAPDSGVRGSIVRIIGRNFKDPNNRVTAIRFTGGTITVPEDSPIIISDREIRVSLPSTATTGPVSIESELGGFGPASQTVFTVDSATTGSVRFGNNPDLSTIVEGSTGTFAQPVRNFGGTGDNTFHRPYQVFVNPAQVTSGVNQGQAAPLTRITVRIRVTDDTEGGRNPVVEVRSDPFSSGSANRVVGRSNADGIIDVVLDQNYDPATAAPILVAIVDAGTDNVPPIIGADASANVRVQAYIVQSDNTALFPLTPNTAVPFVTVARREVVDSNNQTAIAFSRNSTSSFSVPFVSGAGNSVAINDVFNVTPDAGGYKIYRYNAAGQLNNRTLENDFKLVTDGRLQRGQGYLIMTGTQQVQLTTRAAVTNDDTFVFNLTRNVPFAATATAQGNATNGYNFIGFPFNPQQVNGADFRQATVTFNGVDRSVPDAAAAGLINAQLFTRGADGSLVPVPGDQIIQPFQAYFVQIFRDNVTLTLRATQ